MEHTVKNVLKIIVIILFSQKLEFSLLIFTDYIYGTI